MCNCINIYTILVAMSIPVAHTTATPFKVMPLHPPQMIPPGAIAPTSPPLVTMSIPVAHTTATQLNIMPLHPPQMVPTSVVPPPPKQPPATTLTSALWCINLVGRQCATTLLPRKNMAVTEATECREEKYGAHVKQTFWTTLYALCTMQQDDRLHAVTLLHFYFSVKHWHNNNNDNIQIILH